MKYRDGNKLSNYKIPDRMKYALDDESDDTRALTEMAFTPAMCKMRLEDRVQYKYVHKLVEFAYSVFVNVKLFRDSLSDMAEYSKTESVYMRYRHMPLYKFKR